MAAVAVVAEALVVAAAPLVAGVALLVVAVDQDSIKAKVMDKVMAA